MPRSASTWSYNVCRLLFRYLFDETELECGYVGEGKNCDEYFLELSRKINRLLKAHYPGPETLRQIENGSLRNIYTYRDMRDCVVSLMTMFSCSLDEALHSILESLRYYEIYARNTNSLILSYEEVMGRPLETVSRITDFLQIQSDISVLQKIDAETSLISIRCSSTDFSQKKQPQVVQAGGPAYDKVTLLHLGHIHHGGCRWQNELSVAQQQIVCNELRPWLIKFGYGQTSC